MSVRKVYRVVVDGEIVFSGSYAMASAVYRAFECFNSLTDYPDFDVVLAFKPNDKSDSVQGGLLDV